MAKKKVVRKVTAKTKLAEKVAMEQNTDPKNLERLNVETLKQLDETVPDDDLLGDQEEVNLPNRKHEDVGVEEKVDAIPSEEDEVSDVDSEKLPESTVSDNSEPEVSGAEVLGEDASESDVKAPHSNPGERTPVYLGQDPISGKAVYL